MQRTERLAEERAVAEQERERVQSEKALGDALLRQLREAHESLQQRHHTLAEELQN